MQKNEEYIKVGSYTPPGKDGNGEKIIREYFGQGMIFKDEDAFLHRPDDVCYIPELSDTVYTRNSIIEECNGQTGIAECVFYEIDWQHVSSLLDDWLGSEELIICRNCGKMFFSEDSEKCPYCGRRYE
ncbi:MAG: hypothetical protein ACI4HI_18490 [Lachnospiraceae bacterium]